MTSQTPMPYGPSDRASGAPGSPGPFVGIGLPKALAVELAGPRPILSLSVDDIAAAGLHLVDDAVVACLLLGSKADALETIAALAGAGYRGALTVVAPPLPNPQMVERELIRAAKPIQVTLVVR